MVILMTICYSCDNNISICVQFGMRYIIRHSPQWRKRCRAKGVYSIYPLYRSTRQWLKSSGSDKCLGSTVQPLYKPLKAELLGHRRERKVELSGDSTVVIVCVFFWLLRGEEPNVGMYVLHPQ